MVEAARVLYQRLRELDERHIPLAHVVLPPARGLGYALRDRLTKAAAGL
ncbi:MAG: Sua5 family C-terminal domain-containing protein [Ilumatobacteraceae bacterium]